MRRPYRIRGRRARLATVRRVHGVRRAPQIALLSHQTSMKGPEGVPSKPLRYRIFDIMGLRFYVRSQPAYCGMQALISLYMRQEVRKFEGLLSLVRRHQID